MARDHSARERQRKQLERKQGRRASYNRILIVAEGSKTEPNYFNEIRAASGRAIEYRRPDNSVRLGTDQYADVLNGDALRSCGPIRRSSMRSLPCIN